MIKFSFSTELKAGGRRETRGAEARRPLRTAAGVRSEDFYYLGGPLRKHGGSSGSAGPPDPARLALRWQGRARAGPAPLRVTAASPSPPAATETALLTAVVVVSSSSSPPSHHHQHHRIQAATRLRLPQRQSRRLKCPRKVLFSISLKTPVPCLLLPDPLGRSCFIKEASTRALARVCVRV